MSRTASKNQKKQIDPLILELFPSSVRKGDIKKAQIVQAIVDIVATSGLEALSFERIGQEVGIAKSHVVYHFQTKNEMLLKAYQYILNYAQTYIVEGIQNAEPGFDRFEAYVQAHFNWMKIKPNHFPFIVMIYGRSAYDEEIRNFNRQVRSVAKNRIQGLLKEDPRIPESISDEAAIFLHGMVTGALIDLIASHGLPAPASEIKLKHSAILNQAKKYWISLYSKR